MTKKRSLLALVATTAALVLLPTTAQAKFGWNGFYAQTFNSPVPNKGQFNVPKVTCTGTQDKAVATWVGSYFKATNGTWYLVQSGTSSECQGTSSAYSSWFEAYPDPPFGTGFAAHPGDDILITLSLNADNRVLITQKNLTTNDSATFNTGLKVADTGTNGQERAYIQETLDGYGCPDTITRVKFIKDNGWPANMQKTNDSACMTVGGKDANSFWVDGSSSRS